MTRANTSITGIQSSPSTFNLDVLQAGASPQAVSSPTGIQATPSKTIDLKDELAQIQAIKVGQAPQGSGVGQTVGTVGGAGVAAALGAPPQAGAVVGGTVGSIVDYMIDKDAADKAEAKRKEALKKQIEREKAIANSRAITEDRARRRGIALSREEEAMTSQDVINQSRRSMLQNLLSSINQKAQSDEVLKQKFLKSRRVA